MEGDQQKRNPFENAKPMEDYGTEAQHDSTEHELLPWATVSR